MDKKIEEIEDILKKYGQEHLLNHYDKLDETNRKYRFCINKKFISKC